MKFEGGIMKLKLVDKIYGEYLIDGILEELILSKPVQRLKGVHQGGASYLVNETWNGTRYEHSVGVMLLIKKFGGSLEEQVAGLLHDISHTVFSHVIDLVFENEKEDYHEEIYHKVIEESEIPSILSKYGYEYQQILFDDSQWRLLEQPAPELCADRIDYTLRDMHQNGNISLEEIHYFLKNIIVVDGKLYLKNIEIASWFVKTYYQEVIGYFLNPVNIYGYDMLAKALKLALNKKIINNQHLLGTDEEVMSILRESSDEKIQLLLKGIHPRVKVKEDKKNYDFHHKKKVRLIDPSVYVEGKLMRATELSEDIQKMNEDAKRKSEEGMYVRFISH